MAPAASPESSWHAPYRAAENTSQLPSSKPLKKSTYMVVPHLQHHHRLFHRVHNFHLIRDNYCPALLPQPSPVCLSEVPVFQIPRLGLHCQMKLLLCSCHGLGDRVLDFDIHWDIN